MGLLPLPCTQQVIRHLLRRNLVSQQTKCPQSQERKARLTAPKGGLWLSCSQGAARCPSPPAGEPQTAALPVPLPTTVTQAFSPPRGPLDPPHGTKTGPRRQQPQTVTGHEPTMPTG